MEINPLEISKKDRYKLLSGSIIPRPIAFVSTISNAGVANLAPFSFFTGITSDPPTLCFAPNLNSDGTKKDTLINIEENGEFAVHIVSDEIAKAMHESAKVFPPEVNEFAQVGLTEAPAQSIKVPRVKEAKIAMECKALNIVNVGEGGFLVIGEVIHFYFDDAVWQNGYINTDVLNVVGRWAGYDYVKGGQRFQIK